MQLQREVKEPGASDLQKSLVEEVTARIRREILFGRISPGERIRLRTLEDLLGISHIPIREALQRLESEGLVQNIPQRGAIATRISVEELKEVYDLRRVLEPVVAQRAIPRLPEENLRMAAQALREMESIPGGWASPAFGEAHQRFHWALLGPGCTKLMERTLLQLWQTSERYVRFMVAVGGGGPVAERQHRILLHVARARDARRFRRDLRRHLLNTETAVRNALDGQGPPLLTV